MSTSLESAAETVAAQIRRQEYVEVFAHHDADGIVRFDPLPRDAPCGHRYRLGCGRT